MADTAPIIDYSKTARDVALRRMILAPVLAVTLVALGLWELPNGARLFRLDFASPMLGYQILFAHLLIAAGVVVLLMEIAFTARSLTPKGKWHIRLTEDALTWAVPKHAHGREQAFSVPLATIRRVELRWITGRDGHDRQEYWLHLRGRRSIRLRPFSGVNLEMLCLRLRELGVDFEVTSR